MPKQQRRHHVEVHTDNRYIDRDEHRLCSTEGCRNVIAVWALPKRPGPYFCQRCKPAMEHR